MPPKVPTLGPGNVSTGALVDQTTRYVRAFLQCFINDLLGADQFPSTLALVGGDDNFGFGVDHTVLEGIR
jgi:hypothetical protein